MATLINTQVSALLKMGADAMDNLFDVNIAPPPAITAVEPAGQEPFALRCLGFTPPKFTLKTYDVPYKTRKTKRSAGTIEGDRSFQLQFRLDAYYVVYRLLLAWRSAQMQPSTGFAGSALDVVDNNGNSFFGTISVVAADSPISRPLGGKYAQVAGITSGEMGSMPGTFPGVTSGLNWIFHDVWVMDVDNPKFITGSGEVQLVAATFGFGSYTDSQMYDNNFGATGTFQNIIPAQI
jgi:hypothetical protein